MFLQLLGNVAHSQPTREGSLKEAIAEFDQVLGRCLEAGMASAVAACVAAEERRAGDRLNSEYQAALRRLSQKALEMLRNAQRGWLQYQENECWLEGDAAAQDGPGFAALAQAKCLLRTTLVRFGELKQSAATPDDPLAASASLVGFRTPSNNIHCMIEEGPNRNGRQLVSLRCDIAELATKPPPRPRGCDTEWGLSFGIDAAAGVGQRICAGDTVRNENWPILGYGSTWQQKGFTCTSEQSGLTCFNSARHGFSLSRSSQRLF
jgi:uncharacterized protein YecT (DUF1311 family)